MFDKQASDAAITNYQAANRELWLMNRNPFQAGIRRDRRHYRVEQPTRRRPSRRLQPAEAERGQVPQRRERPPLPPRRVQADRDGGGAAAGRILDRLGADRARRQPRLAVAPRGRHGREGNRARENHRNGGQGGIRISLAAHWRRTQVRLGSSIDQLL